MIRSNGGAVLALLVILVSACGGGAASPTAPAPLPSAAPTPAPAPTPTPCTEGLCEPPVTNTAPPVRVTLHLYAVEDGQGKLVPGITEADEIPAGYVARLDVTAKDENGLETNGSSNVLFFFSDPSLVRSGASTRSSGG